MMINYRLLAALSGATLAAVLIGSPADAQLSNCSSTDPNCPSANNEWTFGRQAGNSIQFKLHDSIKSECMNAAYNGHLIWNSSAVNSNFVWAGYQYGPSTISRYYNGQNLIATAANEPTVVQTAVGDVGSTNQALTGVEFGTYNSTTRRYNVKEGDTLISPAAMDIMYCAGGTAPNTQYEMRYIMAHEKGHTMGLQHMGSGAVGADIMYGYTRQGPGPIVPSQNDLRRGQYPYGSK